MGLEAVEILMAVERHFGVSFQRDETARVRTVGDLVSLIQARLSAARLAVCPTLPAFLKLRAVVRDATDNCALRIRPSELIADRLSAPQRRRLWRSLGEQLGSPPRGLRRPRPLRQLLAALVVVLLGAALVTAAAIDLNILPATLALAAFVVFLTHLATLPLRSTPPEDWTTFGDLTQKLVGVKFATKQLHLRSHDEILTELRPLIVDALGVDLDEVVADARFAEDLGAG